MFNHFAVEVRVWVFWTDDLRSIPADALGFGWGGLVVSVLTSYSDDLSTNPAKANSFFVKCSLKEQKLSRKSDSFTFSK